MAPAADMPDPVGNGPDQSQVHRKVRIQQERASAGASASVSVSVSVTDNGPANGLGDGPGPAPTERGPPRMQSTGGGGGRDGGAAGFPRLSKPVELMRNSYDSVVIGSGYGGGVAASRMARAGQSVCLLERGRERWPGEYPTETRDALDQVHCSGEAAPGWLPSRVVRAGDPTGLYHVIFGKGQNAVVANGLGGTSLINANVFLEADRDTLTQEAWPEEIRENAGCLDSYYAKAAEVLEPQAYPEDWPRLAKLEVLRKQAEALGMGRKFGRVRTTTRYRNGPNRCGVEMSRSSLTGQDGTGLNDGSKNSTLVTYLADAWNWGADMFCECEVRHVVKAVGRDGYIVYFAWHGRRRGQFKAQLHSDLMWVHARNAVFFGAGAIGTTEILLRSKEMGLDLSDQVGQGMSGNGDMLAFAYNTDQRVNGIGRASPSPYQPVGPCITGMIDNRGGHGNALDGYVVQEGTIPQALAPFLQAMLELLPGRVGPAAGSMWERVRARLARAGSFLLGPYLASGALQRTQTYLVMSHDSNQATLTLNKDRPVLEFIGVGRSDHVRHLNAVLQKATRAIGGTFVQNPFSALTRDQQQLTVHPIGGACMARDGTGATGATNHLGELFCGDGADTHRGLLVTDGAVIPTALGANPLATITALAERAVEHYARREKLRIRTQPNRVLDLFGPPQHPHQHQRRRRRRHQHDVIGTDPDADADADFDSDADSASESDPASESESDSESDSDSASAEDESISNAETMMRSAARMDEAGFGFTEVMAGFIHRHDGGPAVVVDRRETYEQAARAAEASCESARLFVSVQSFNTRATVRDPDHAAVLTGTFSCPTIAGSPFIVRRGDLGLFRQADEAAGTRKLVYRFDMRGVDGRRLRFCAYKLVDASVVLAPRQFWRATSTLYVTISRAGRAGRDGRGGRTLAQGILRLQTADLASQLRTMAPTGRGRLGRAWAAAVFVAWFARTSLSLVLAPLAPLQYPSPSYDGFINETAPTASYSVVASDGVLSRLHVWEPTAGQARPLFMVAGAAVDQDIFALPTIRYNAVNYFRRAGYRVFVAVHRIGALAIAQNGWTTYDARLDIKACLVHIRAQHGPAPVYTIAHCMGSVALATGLLDGTIPSAWILGLTCSQVFMNPVWTTPNMVKATAGPVPLDRLYSALAGPWFSCSTGADDSWLQAGLNQALRFLPGPRRELCNSASCHRTSLAFGRCWNHANLNDATHRQIDRFFGGVNMTLLSLLMRQGVAGGVCTNGPRFDRLDTDANIRRRLAGIPILLFVGRDNAVLSPAATEETYEKLCDTFGLDGAQYTRRVVPGYGHLDCWMGRNAWRDVYPFIRAEVDRVVRGEGYRFQEPLDRFWRMVEDGTLLD